MMDMWAAGRRLGSYVEYESSVQMEAGAQEEVNGTCAWTYYA